MMRPLHAHNIEGVEKTAFCRSQDDHIRLMPIPGCFLCPISQEVMVDPVSTVDGSVYEREYIEQWFRQREQQHEPLTSPATGVVLRSKLLLPLMALKKAVEAYLAHRPELQRSREARQSYKEAARLLQNDLDEKSKRHARVREQQCAVRAKVARVKQIRDKFVKLQQQNAKLTRVTHTILQQLKKERGRTAHLTKELKMQTRRLERAREIREDVQDACIWQAQFQAIEYGCMAQLLQLGKSRGSQQHEVLALSGGETEDEVVNLVDCSPTHL